MLCVFFQGDIRSVSELSVEKKVLEVFNIFAGRCDYFYFPFASAAIKYFIQMTQSTEGGI